jgi:hypothetical protein
LAEIEIVFRDCTLDRVTKWLDMVTGPIGSPSEAGTALVYATRFGSVIVQPGMGSPGGISVWFRSNELPWASCAACARQACREIEGVVWCDPGKDYPEVNPLASVFLEVDRYGERLVSIEDSDIDSDS